MKKRLLCLAICIAIMFSYVSVPVGAADDGGENLEWIEVYTVEDLQAINLDMSANYKLMNDIDLTEDTAPGGDWDSNGFGWNPIGGKGVYAATSFDGVFDGNGHTIKGMRIEATSVGGNFGLFAKVTGSIINLSVEGSISISKGWQFKVGSIAAESDNATFTNCKSYCNINVDSVSSGYAESNIGGIVGYHNNWGESRWISCCINLGDISVPKENGYCRYKIGGIVGAVGGRLYMTDCYNTGNIICKNSAGGNSISGLFGSSGSYESEVFYCYNTGLIRFGTPDNMVSSGTAVGSNKNCYFLKDSGVGSGESLTETQMKIQSSFVGFDFENTWIMYPDSNYRYPQLRSNPIDTGNAVTSLEMSVLPSKLTYLEGKDSLNVSGGKLTIEFNDGTVETKSLTRDMVTGFDNSKVGLQTLTVTFGRNTTTYNVTVIPKSLAGISVQALPTKTQYIEGLENINLAGGVLLMTYDNGTTETVPLSNALVTGFNNSIVGENQLTVSYRGFETTFNVQIIPKSISSIEMKMLPSKTQYIEGKETFDATGGQILVKFNNGTQEIVNLTNDMVSGFSNSVVGSRRLTVTYNSKKTYFDVEIIAKSVSSITMQTLPNKLSYVEGLEQLSVAGGKVQITYNNDTTSTINLTADMVSGFSNAVVGTKTLTVKYSGASTTFQIRIVAKSVASIELSRYPTKLIYLEAFDNFEADGGKVRIVYNNGTYDETDLTAAMVTGFDNTRVGSQTLTVSHAGKTTTFQVEITAKKLVSIEMNDLPAKVEYLEGKDDLSVLGARIKLNYNNGTSGILDVTKAMLSGFDNTRIGQQTITVTYNGLKTTFTVTVIGKSVATIAIASNPSKLTYVENKELLDVAGGTILVTYDNDEEETIAITGAMISGFDNSAAGYATVTVTYGDAYDTFEVEIIHDYVAEIHEPTCVEAGYTVYACAHCGDTYTEAGEAATGHSFVKYVSNGDATCTEDGTATAKCEHCDETHTIVETGSATGHSFGDWIIDVEATESAPGHKHRECAHCGVVDEKTIPQLGNTPVIKVSDIEALSGQEFNVEITLENNPGIIAMSLNVNYDPEMLTFVGASEGDFAGLSYGPTENVPFVVSWEDALHGNNSTNGTFVILRFKLNENATLDETSITLSYDEENIFDVSFDNVPFDTENGTVSVKKYVPGDVNRDGKVNLKDYALLKQFVNGWDVDVEESVADVNGDGKINLKDVALLNQFVNGWDVVLR